MREPDDWTRRLAHRVDSCIDRDRTILDKLAARERIPDLIDCTPERLATEAIRADQEWVWAALSLLRWLCEPWPARCTRCGSDDAKPCPDCGEPFCPMHLSHPRICGEGPDGLCRERSLASWQNRDETRAEAREVE